MPFDAFGRQPSSSRTTSTLKDTTSTYGVTKLSRNAYFLPQLALPLGTLLIHPLVSPLVSFASTADCLGYLVIALSTTSNVFGTFFKMPRSLRLPKNPVKTKTSAVRHDEHSERPRPIVDPACPICQVDIGTRSPEGVREGYAVTPCGHVFGSVCIKKYLAITADKPLCPVCRSDLYHACAHPVLPAGYDPKKSRLSREEAAAKAFPDGHRNIDCAFCLHRRAKAARRMRKRELLERMTRSSRGREETGSSASASASASSYASGSSGAGSGEEEEGSSDSESSAGSPSGRTKALRLALHIVHSTSALARLTLGTIRLRKVKASGDHGSPRSSDDSEEYREDDEDDDDEADGDGDIVVPDSPQLVANRGSFLPVPGSYGHWDLANKGPDWRFLGWYDSQEPKMKTTPEQFS